MHPSPTLSHPIGQAAVGHLMREAAEAIDGIHAAFGSPAAYVDDEEAALARLLALKDPLRLAADTALPVDADGTPVGTTVVRMAGVMAERIRLSRQCTTADLAAEGFSVGEITAYAAEAWAYAQSTLGIDPADFPA